jgi:hypothetical protein
MLEDIIPPVDRSLLENELTDDKFIKKTNNGDNLIYIVTAHDSPHLMQEIGRLREVTFRDAGGGIGKPIDIDVFDTCENPFHQLIVWNPEDREITGGYRFIHGREMMHNTNHQPLSPTAEIFTFSNTFISEFLPVTIELGRSWVQPAYQPYNDFRKGLYSLDNLWDGLGGLITTYPDIEYFFGKITMYTSYNVAARNLLLSFMHHYFPDPDGLVTPLPGLAIDLSEKFPELQSNFSGDNYEQDYKQLIKLVKQYGEMVPPLMNAYMNLSTTMRTFGTANNPHFGDVEETGILIRIQDIHVDKKERHLKS